MWCARDSFHEIKYYDPQQLPLWEATMKKPKSATKPKPKPRPRLQNPKYAGQKRLQFPTLQRPQNQPPYKRRN